MANRNQRRIAAERHKELVAKKKANGDFRQVNPPRQNSQKNFSKYTTFTGFRKDTRHEKAERPLPKVYKELATA